MNSLKEFVRPWGSGHQASFQIQCYKGQAWFKLESQLGHPAFQHFIPHHNPKDVHHGYHGDVAAQHSTRHKGLGQRRRDQTQAVAHQTAATSEVQEVYETDKVYV